MRVASLHIYPVKSAHGIDLSSVMVKPMGLAHDRQWMIVDADGQFLTQRDVPQLARLFVAVDETGALHLSADHQFHERVDIPTSGALPVTVWNSKLEAIPAGGDISAKLSAWIGRKVQLVRFPDTPQRLSQPHWAGDNVPVGFADGFPVLVALAASLANLNARMATPIPMARFRPNIVIDGAAAWADDGWQRIKIGDLELELVKPCERCLVTTTDQETGARLGPEPLATLATFRRSAVAGISGVLFGSNAVPRVPGRISVGDKVDILATRTPWSVTA